VRLTDRLGRWSLVAVLVATMTAATVGSVHAATTGGVTAPEPNVGWDYQIGGAFAPADDVAVVDRDRKAAPVAGRYNICYVNAFQTQGDEKAFWRKHARHWALVLKTAAGKPVVDSAWGEFLLDTRTPSSRQALIAIVGRWIDGCARHGFDAVELDNLDSWNRSRHLVTRADNRAFARLLTARAHADGLAAAQKNWAELRARGPRLGFDFAIAEECGRWQECGSYATPYADRVFDVEYRRKDFEAACAAWGDRISIVFRDLDVTPTGPDQRC
jgi:hypothetical protein